MRVFGNILTKDSVTNEVSKDLKTKFKIQNEDLEIIIKGAMFGDVGNKKEILLDEVSVNDRLKLIAESISKTNTKYNFIPKKIVIYNEDEKTEEVSKDIKTDAELFNSYEPSWTLDDVYINEEEKNNILTALSMVKFKKKLFEEWNVKGNKGNGRAVCLNFWGSPGTGKSMTAEAVANYLNKKLLIVNYPELESKYVGETPKNIKKVFNKAKEEDTVIVFDEADSFLGKRLENVTQSADYGVNITRSVMLIELESFDGVVIFTTNLLTNYDEAFKRRILANIKFDLPDEQGRKVIWKAHMPKEMPVSDDVTIDKLALEFINISGADIKDIVLFAATEALRNNKDMVSYENFKNAYKLVISRYTKDSIEYRVTTERISEEEYKKQMDNGENGTC